MKIFLSFNSKEAPSSFISRLQAELYECGFDVVNNFESCYTGESYSDSINDSINKCDLIIAFITENSPNAMYELGYAMGKGKQVLIVSDEYSKIPLELKNVPNIIRRYADDINTIYEVLNFIDNIKSKRGDIELDEHTGFKDLLELYYTDLNEFDQIGPKDFEYLLFEWFKDKNLSPIEKCRKDDIGYDFSLSNYKHFMNTLVEVKKYNVNNKVSLGKIQQFLGVLNFYNADHGIFISSSGYTNSAVHFAEKSTPKIELWSMDDII